MPSREASPQATQTSDVDPLPTVPTTPQSQRHNNSINQYKVKEHAVFKSIYPQTYKLPNSFKETTIAQLKSQANNREPNEIIDRTSTFIFCVLLKIIYKPPQSQPGYRYISARNNNSKKDGKELRNFRRMFVFASILDNSQLEFAITEMNGADEDKIWKYKKAKTNVTVGDKFCILEPYLKGHLTENNLALIETNWPFVQLKAPSLPERSNINVGQDGEKYFIHKHLQIHFSNLVVVETKCGGTLCDRTRIAEDPGLCGCYTNNTKNTGTTASMSFLFDIDASKTTSTEGTPHVSRFNFFQVTSLRTTKLFYEKKIIPANSIADYQAPEVINFVRSKTSAFIEHVNRNDGWTIIGWAKRGMKNSNPEEADRTASEDIKYHISYLYPTTRKYQTHLDPETHLIQTDILRMLVDYRTANTNQYGDDDDLV